MSIDMFVDPEADPPVDPPARADERATIAGFLRWVLWGRCGGGGSARP
jgi:hypothetical protein